MCLSNTLRASYRVLILGLVIYSQVDILVDPKPQAVILKGKAEHFKPVVNRFLNETIGSSYGETSWGIIQPGFDFTISKPETVTLYSAYLVLFLSCAAVFNLCSKLNCLFALVLIGQTFFFNSFRFSLDLDV